MSSLLICNAQIVNEGLIQEADVFIQDGRISQIGPDLSHLASQQFIDAYGQYLLPGMIDSNFRLASEVDFNVSLFQESRASIAGGITSSLLLPNLLSESHATTELPFDLKDIQLQHNLSQYYPVTHDSLEGLVGADSLSYCGAYVDMSNTDDGIRIDRVETLERIFQDTSLLVALHAEDAPSILEREESYRQIYGDDIPFNLHGFIRSSEACYIAANVALELAIKTNSSAHLLNISSAKEIELIEKLQKKSLAITADVGSYYLTFSDADYVGTEGILKCSPSIKTDIDRATLIQGLLDNNINNINSCHLPVRYSEKQGSYFDVCPGLPLAQYTMPSILEHYQDEILSLELIAQKTSHSVADRFSIEDRGYIREGYWADLVLLDLEGSFIARDEDVVSGADWTIFNGNEFRSSVVATIINGAVVWKQGEFQGIDPSGQRLTFTNTE